MKPRSVYALALGTTELQSWLGLAQLKAADRRIALSALREYGTPSQLFGRSFATAAKASAASDMSSDLTSDHAFCDIALDRLRARFGQSFARSLAELPRAALLREAEEALAWQAANPATRHIVALADPAYPARLLEAADPPMLLFVHGHLALLAEPSIAVVGSRKPSQRGLENAYAFSRALVQAGWTIVSGLAQGIDARAHQAALDELGTLASLVAGDSEASGAPRADTTSASTIAVIGAGIDVTYPWQHRHLSEAIAGVGAIVSEWPLGTPPRAAHFPQRNRLIAALSHGVLVVEATLRSGSLITARIANDIGRDVFAIPGSIHAPQSRGCHALIKDGAKLVESVDDILDELRPIDPSSLPQTRQAVSCSRSSTSAAFPARRPQCKQPRAAPVANPRHPPRDAIAQHVLTLLGHDPATADTLAARGGWDAATLIGALSQLEIGGWVEQHGGRYARTAG